MKRAISRANAASDCALILPPAKPKKPGRSCVRKVSRVTTPNVPTPPPLIAGGHYSALDHPRRCGAEAFGKGAEAAALNEPRDTHRRATAALDVARALRRHGVIEIHPHRTRFGADSRNGRRALFATLAHECIVQ